jgi:hypothetical protein
MIEFNVPPLSGLFLDAFGVKIGGIYRPEASTGKADDPAGLFTGIEIIEDINDAYEMSALGTPILWPILFSKSDLAKKYNNKGELIDFNSQDFRLPIASIISFRRDKIMSTTKINGGRGTVKEIYGFDDWQITINGFLIPDGSQPQGLKNPLQQEKELIKWDNCASRVDVFGELFAVRGIKSLTIKGINFEPLRGKPNIRAYTINALSDEPIELNIKSSI